MTKNQLALARRWDGVISAQAISDINSVDKNRLKRRINYNKFRDLNKNVTVTQTVTVTDTVPVNVSGSVEKVEKEEEKEEDNKYMFKRNTIRLNERDYTRWKEKYNLVDLDYELEQMDCWFQEAKNVDRQKDWFWIVQKSLAKKQKEKYDALPKGINGKPIQNYHEW